MNKVLFAAATMLTLLAAACVTINVYFPEAAAEQAADRIIDRVRGQTPEGGASLYDRGDGADRETATPVMVAAAQSLVNAFIAPAAAQSNVDFDATSPKVSALENSMAQRYPQLEPYYDSGAIGMDENGLVEIRDRNLIPLKDRNNVLQLVAAQNNDWNALYQEIASLNGHPEWVDSIRRTFASRWVAKADSGWWYREGGTWKQK